ncbi:MAG TPA: ATP-binding protein [Polyangiaceae bacterium]
MSLVSRLRGFREFVQKVDDAELQDLHEHTLGGIRSMAVVLAVVLPGGPIYCLTEKLHTERVPLVLSTHVAVYLGIRWLAGREFGRKHTGFVMALLAVAMAFALTFVNAWLYDGPPVPAALIYATMVPLMVGIFVPWRPLLTIGLAVPALVSIYVTHFVLGTPLPLRAETMANAALCIAVCSAIGIQSQRRLWRSFERTRKLLGRAEREANARSEEAARRAADIRGILDNVGDGFVRLDREGHMSNERSAILSHWFGAADDGASFADYVRRFDPQQADAFEASWGQLVDGVLPVELAVDQLPSRIRAAERALSVRYRPVLEDGQLREVIVIVSDVTAELERERAEAEVRDLLGVLRSILRDREAFADFAREGTRLVAAATDPETPLAVRLRQIHTLKGNSALFQLESVARLCHDVETRLLQDDGTLAQADRERLLEVWKPVAALAGTDAAEAEVALDVDSAEQTIVMRMLMQEPRRPDVVTRLATWHFEPAARKLIHLGDRARATAERLQKGPLAVVIDDGGVRLPRREWSPLWNALVHVVRNAIDHGFESQAEREAAGKPGTGTLTLKTAATADQILLEISDDGRGVNWDAIRSQAVQHGLAHATQADLVRALFADGVTSRTEATEFSGRGVGMSAVQEACRNLGGSIEVVSAAGRGTSVCLRFPKPVSSDAVVRGSRSARVEPAA